MLLKATSQGFHYCRYVSRRWATNHETYIFNSYSDGAYRMATKTAGMVLCYVVLQSTWCGGPLYSLHTRCV